MRHMTQGVYSERLEKAIQKAVQLHKNQVRRSPDGMPYVSHLISVYIILSSYTQDEDTLIAGLLHDAIEDTEYTLKELEADFGQRVAGFVQGVTEEKERDGKPLSWKERKRGYLKNLKHDSEESLLICVADKIYNLQALVRDYQLFGMDMWNFIQPGLKEKLWYHKEVISILEERLKNKTALNDLKKEFKKAKAILAEEEQTKEIKSPFTHKNGLSVLSFRSIYRSRRRRAGTLRLKVLSAKILGYGNRNTS